ncbi:MAG: LptA/OstA family protein [Nitrospirota bacterium]
MWSRNGVVMAALLGAIGSIVPSWAADVAGPLASRPLAITSRSMTVKNLDHRVIFDKDVTVIKGDMDLQADRVEVVLAKPAQTAASNSSGNGAGPDMLSEGNIERIVAEGRVKVVQGKKTATADHAVYHRADETVVLTGHPETWEEGVRIQGSKITILLKEQRSIVDESRVVIYPEAGGDSTAPTDESRGDHGK